MRHIAAPTLPAYSEAETAVFCQCHVLNLVENTHYVSLRAADCRLRGSLKPVATS